MLQAHCDPYMDRLCDFVFCESEFVENGATMQQLHQRALVKSDTFPGNMVSYTIYGEVGLKDGSGILVQGEASVVAGGGVTLLKIIKNPNVSALP